MLLFLENYPEEFDDEDDDNEELTQLKQYELAIVIKIKNTKNC